MSTRSPNDVTLSLRVARLEWPPTCEGCSAPLEVHQPDPWLPDRLVLSCGGCRAWTLAMLMPDGVRSLLVALPGGPELLAAATASGID